MPSHDTMLSGHTTGALTFKQAMLLITACFAFVAIGVAAVAGVSRYHAHQGSQLTQKLTGEFLPGLMTLARLQKSALDLKSLTLQFALAKDEAGMNAKAQAFQLETERAFTRIAERGTRRRRDEGS